MTFATLALVTALSAASDAPLPTTSPGVAAGPVVYAPASPGPVVSAPAVGCGGCTTPAADCGCVTAANHCRGGLFSRLFSRRSSHGGCGCGTPAPACPACAPAPVIHHSPKASCDTCDPCATTKHARPGFFGSFFGGKKPSACGCAPAAPDCGCAAK